MEISNKPLLIGIYSLGIVFCTIALCGVNNKIETTQVSDITIQQIVHADTQTTDDIEATVSFLPITETVENANVVSLEQLGTVYLEEQAQIAEAERVRKEEEANRAKAKLSYSPFERSGLTIEQYNNILAGTGLAGCGESYYNMEQTYGVNGIYAIAVAVLESGAGRATANTHNYYGMRGNNGWMSFDSADANIQYFGRLMTRPLYNGKSILQIGRVYCPGTYEHWAGSVSTLMETYYAKR